MRLLSAVQGHASEGQGHSGFYPGTAEAAIQEGGTWRICACDLAPDAAFWDAAASRRPSTGTREAHCMVAGGPERPLRPAAGSTNHRHKQLLPQRQYNCFSTQPQPPQPVVMGPYMSIFELFYYLIDVLLLDV